MIAGRCTICKNFTDELKCLVFSENDGQSEERVYMMCVNCFDKLEENIVTAASGRTEKIVENEEE